MGQQSPGERWRAQPSPWEGVVPLGSRGAGGGARKSLPDCFSSHLGLKSGFRGMKGGNERQRHKSTVNPKPFCGHCSGFGITSPSLIAGTTEQPRDAWVCTARERRSAGPRIPQETATCREARGMDRLLALKMFLGISSGWQPPPGTWPGPRQPPGRMRLKCNDAAFHIRKRIRAGTQTRLSRERGNAAETTCFLAGGSRPPALPPVLLPTCSPPGCVTALAQALAHPVVPSQPDPHGRAPEQRRLVGSGEIFSESRCHSWASSQARSWLQAEARRATSGG